MTVERCGRAEQCHVERSTEKNAAILSTESKHPYRERLLPWFPAKQVYDALLRIAAGALRKVAGYISG